MGVCNGERCDVKVAGTELKYGRVVGERDEVRMAAAEVTARKMAYGWW